MATFFENDPTLSSCNFLCKGDYIGVRRGINEPKKFISEQKSNGWGLENPKKKIYQKNLI